jgi:hypothetical protein
MKIIPALLAENLDEFVMRMRQVEKFADYVQVDIMDGVFVDTRSFDVEMINNIQTPLSFEKDIGKPNPDLTFFRCGFRDGLSPGRFHLQLLLRAI